MAQHQELRVSSIWNCGPATRATPRVAETRDRAVVPSRPAIMPEGHGRAMPQTTAVDDQFGTHKVILLPPSRRATKPEQQRRVSRRWHAARTAARRAARGLLLNN